MVRALLSIVAAVALLEGCATPVCSCGALYVSPTPTPALQPGFAVLVTEKDHAVTVLTGQKVELYLRARPGMTDWGGVNVDNSSVLRAVPTGIAATKGVTIAGFEAVSTGTATIRATATPLCSPGQACSMLAMLYQLTVTVT